MGKQKRYSLEFRERAVRRMKLGDNVSRLARELGVDRTCLYIWKRKLEQRPYRKRTNNEEPDWRDHRIEELEGQDCAPRGSHWRAVVGSGFFRECLAQDRGESTEERRK